MVVDQKGVNGEARVAAGSQRVASAEVRWTPTPKVCVELVAQGELCTPF